MISISRTVEKILEERPFIQEALARGIINYVALAEEIKPNVEDYLGRNVKIPAIMMALRRNSEKLEKKIAKRPKFEKNTDIFIKSNLFEITIKKTKRNLDKTRDLYKFLNGDEDFLTITSGLHELTIISNGKYKDKMRNIFGLNNIIKEIGNLAAIGTKMPKNAVYEVGYFYTITRGFSLENIPIIEIISTLNEITLVLKESDIPRGFPLLKRIINNNQ